MFEWVGNGHAILRRIQIDILIWHKYLDIWWYMYIYIYIHTYGFIHGNVFLMGFWLIGIYYPFFACLLPSCWCHRLQLRVHEAARKHNALRMWFQPDHIPLTMENGATSPWEKSHAIKIVITTDPKSHQTSCLMFYPFFLHNRVPPKN